MKNTKFYKIFISISKQIGIIILYFFLIYLLSFIFYNGLKSKNFLITNLSNILVELIILTVFIIIFRKKIIPDFYDFKKNGKDYISDNFKYWVSGLIVMVFSNLIINRFLTLPSNESQVRLIFTKLPIYYFVTSLVIAPIVEELLTRAILKDTFKHKIIYYILSGLLFGSLHLLVADSIWEVFYLIPYGALGFAFAVIYNKTNNIWTNIFFHTMHNTIATLSFILLGMIV